MSDSDFFIGWSDEMPSIDRRVFIGTGLGLMAGTFGVAGLLASTQSPVGNGTWAMGEVREWSGYATSSPYAMLRTDDIDGSPKTALLGCLGKCGVAARLNSYDGKAVSVTGSLIQRGRHSMIAVVDGPEWIKEASRELPEPVRFPEIEMVSRVDLTGEILDSKCWFGAMRPSSGKVHKACASLCIRGGIPPAFYAKGSEGRTILLVMTNNGEAHGEDLLEYVADPVRITGEARRQGDLLLLDAPVSAITRV